MRLQPNEMANAIWEQERGGSVADGLGWPNEDADDCRSGFDGGLCGYYIAADNDNRRKEVRRAG